MALSGMKGLQAWCQQVANGYRDVKITNMTSSWRDGLAFCAIIHHYRPDLIDYDSLSKENIEHNNNLAFTVAESLSIPALLDVEDMVIMTVPDKLSIMTYVSQYYNYFRDKPPGGSAPKATTKRPNTTPPAKSSVPTNKKMPPIKSPMGNKPVESKKDHPCTACGKPVYLMERLTAEGKLYHRLCLKCCVCGIRLKASNYRYRTVDQKFYCQRDHEAVKNGKSIENGSKPDESSNRDHRSTSEPSPVSLTNQAARNRFFSENDTKSTKSTSSDQSRTQAASYLSGLISNSAERNAKMQKQISAPSGYPSPSKEPNSNNLPVFYQGYHKPSDIDTNLSSVQEINDSPMEETTKTEKDSPKPGKPKKLVLKVKKKRPKAAPRLDKNKETTPDAQPTNEQQADEKGIVANLPNGTSNTNTNSQGKDYHRNDVDNKSSASPAKKDVTIPHYESMIFNNEINKSKETSKSNDEKHTSSSKRNTANTNQHEPHYSTLPVTKSLPRKINNEQSNDEVSNKKDSLVPKRTAPQRPPPATQPTTTTKRKAPERPSYKPPGDVSPRFVGPRAPRLNEPDVKVEKRIALRDKQLSLQDIAAELRLNDARQAELEKRGVRMEKKLRSQAKGDPAEEYLIEWFDLVNEKNKLLRRENELIYMTQELEFLKKQQDIECELRNLLEKSEHTKTNKDRKREEHLLNQLLEFVSKRDQIVGRLEEDRIREIEEDKVIAIVMEEQGLTRKSKKTSRFFF